MQVYTLYHTLIKNYLLIIINLSVLEHRAGCKWVLIMLRQQPQQRLQDNHKQERRRLFLW